MLEILGLGTISWLLGKILEDSIEARFDAKTDVLQDEFLLYQYRLQLERENELFRQYLMIMHFLGKYSELISFRTEFLEEMLMYLDGHEELSDCISCLKKNVIGENNGKLSFYKSLEALSLLGRFLEENPNHKLVPLFFHVYVEERSTMFREGLLSKIEGFFKLEELWLDFHQPMFQFNNKGKLLERNYFQVLESLKTNQTPKLKDFLIGIKGSA